MSKATIDDVAKLAGVSIKTVSRVVNQEPNVRDGTRARVEEAVSALNYKPSQSARSLASRRSYLIGLLYDDPSRYEIPSSGYVIRLQLGLLKACKSANYDLLIHPCGYRDRYIGKDVVAFIEHSRVDGIVLAPPLSNIASAIRAINATGTPFVRIAPGDSDKGQLTVRTNDREVSAEMTSYLASLQHRRIAFIAGDAKHKAVANRYLGYRDGLKSSGLPFAKSLVLEGDNSILSGERCARRFLRRKSPPTAIFASNDDMAAGVLRVAHEFGIDVPGQLSVAGFDNIPLAQQIFPTLTTVNQPLQTMAERAGLILIDALRTKSSAAESELVPGQLVIRESTGPAPARR